MRNAKAGAKMYATKTNARLIHESMPREVLEHESATAQLKLAIQAKLENLKGKYARLGHDSSELWYLNMADDAASSELLATLLGARWVSRLSPSSVERVIKEYVKVPAKIEGVEVCLTRQFGVPPRRHQEELVVKFEYDSGGVAKLTCPTGYLQGHGLPGASSCDGHMRVCASTPLSLFAGPAAAYALQVAYEKTR